jgi:hypothetical protein
VDKFEPGVPFSLTGHPLRPNINGGPGSARTDDAQRRLLVAMAARRQLHGNLLCLEEVIEAGLIDEKSYQADLARLIGRLSIDWASETAGPTLDAFLSSLEKYATRGWLVPWGMESSADVARLSRRPPWLARLQVFARGLSLVFIENAPPETVAAALDVPWPMELPWSADTLKAGGSSRVPAGSIARQVVDAPELIGAR